ncbi:MAG: N-acetylmuramoyl-L-alanine amidase [Chloroflexota bacterium]|nr:N-acetylmuramoyl-L-alanine amidase [Chloroflexota bacterium]
MPDITWIGTHANNFLVGRQGATPSAIVVHWIVGRLAAADATFQDPNRRASAHYGVDGHEIHQYVCENDTAYTNRNWWWNTHSITIEHAGGPTIPITDATYQSSAWLIRDICTRWKIPLDREHIRIHREVADVATQCPGTLDVDRLIALARQEQGGSDDVTYEQDFSHCFITLATRWPNDQEVAAWRESGLSPYEWCQRFAPNPPLDNARIQAFGACFITQATRWPTEEETQAWIDSGLSAYEWVQAHAPNVVRDQKEEEIRALHIKLEEYEQTGAADVSVGRKFRDLVGEVI